MKKQSPYGKRNLFMSTTLMSGLFIMAFQFDSNGIYWMWKESIQVPIVLSIVTLILGYFWFIENKKLKN